jgi:hypothetical protein
VIRGRGGASSAATTPLPVAVSRVPVHGRAVRCYLSMVQERDEEDASDDVPVTAGPSPETSAPATGAICRNTFRSAQERRSPRRGRAYSQNAHNSVASPAISWGRRVSATHDDRALSCLVSYDGAQWTQLALAQAGRAMLAIGRRVPHYACGSESPKASRHRTLGSNIAPNRIWRAKP